MFRILLNACSSMSGLPLARLPRSGPRILAGMVGFSCLLPGISVVTVAGVGIQPILPLLLVYGLAFPLRSLRLPVQPILWAIVNGLGLLASFAFGAAPAGAMFAMLQTSYFVAAGVGFGTILGNANHRGAFVSGYLAGALLSSLLGIAQAAFSQITEIPVNLANNANFYRAAPLGRAMAFTPEASILAGLLLPALACVWLEGRKPESPVPSSLTGFAAIVILCAGLLATRSTLLVVAPLVLAGVVLFVGGGWFQIYLSVRRIVIFMCVAGLLFVPVYSVRVGPGDDAGWSRAWRMLKIETGLQIFEENPLLGRGPGYVSDQIRFASHLHVPSEMRWMRDPTKGVDSTFVRILAEGGIVGFLLTYYPLLMFWRRARVLAGSVEFRALFCLCLPLLVAQVVTIGYRDMIVLLLPCVAFAMAGDTVVVSSFRRGIVRRVEGERAPVSVHPGTP